FADSTAQLGKTDVEVHTIPTQDVNPVALRPYQYNPEIQEFINKEIEEMLKAGIIEKSRSPWAFPVVIVSKKNGKKRLCVNYKKLNEVTKTDGFPMPLIEEIFNSLQGAKWFSSIDLASGFWQVELAVQDKEK